MHHRIVKVAAEIKILFLATKLGLVSGFVSAQTNWSMIIMVTRDWSFVL